MKATFEHTVSVLVKAYLNDELMHGDCEACAVGNIVHAAGFPRYNAGQMPYDSCGMWKGVFVTDEEGIQHFNNPSHPSYCFGLAKIKATGYSVAELASVEFAFETALKGSSKDEWMFNGLMEVVDVLAEIHNIDLSIKDQAKKLFVKV